MRESSYCVMTPITPGDQNALEVTAPGEQHMKSVIAFAGSARKKGTTHAAARQFLDYLQSYGDVRGEIVFLSEHSLGLCRGCKVCFERGEEYCPLKGDRDLLVEKMMSSDGVVFASPNYSFNVSAIMKSFLDRLGFVFHRPRFHGKSFTGIVIQGIYGGSKIAKYLEFVGGGLGFNVVKGSCITALEPMSLKDRQKMDSTLARQSRRFHQQLLRPAYPVPSIVGLMGFRMSRTSIQQMLDEGNRDYVYYRDHGWFESDYYYPTTLGPLKNAVGASFDWIAARTFRRAEPRSAPNLSASASQQTAEEDEK
jgi:multimeric flavodoxin WrbA